MQHLLPFLLLCLGCPLFLGAQHKGLVDHNGITSPLHQAHLGKIVFAPDPLPNTPLGEEDFLDTMVLRNKADLNLIAYLENSLTNYLHALAPELSAEQLAQQGNYQFTFYLNGQRIYQENLHPGAGSPDSKHRSTLLGAPLLSSQKEHLWSRFLWARFMANGGEQALPEGRHHLKIELRPYVKAPELIEGPLIAEGTLMLIVEKPSYDLSKISLSPPAPDSGWPVTRKPFNREKIKELKAAIEEEDFMDISSLLVIREGRLLIEEYFNGATRNSLHDTRSVGKSFASTLTGIAIQEGYLEHEHQRLEEFYELKSYDHYSPIKNTITLKELLTMGSPFEGDDGLPQSAGNEENMYPTDNWVKFALDLPLDSNRQRGKWRYFTAGVVLLGDILHRRVPGGLEAYAAEKLFTPLGINHYQWQYTPQGVVNTAGSLQMRTLDYAKWAQLYKNGGRWKGRQLLPEGWIDKSFSRQQEIPAREGEYYGYLFWNKTFHLGGQAYETYYSAGNGGNRVYIFKDHPLVVVITATAYNTPYGHTQVEKMMQQYILPAVVNNQIR
jgi:CubicO group peptidase (beta-lactamase class C family)